MCPGIGWLICPLGKSTIWPPLIFDCLRLPFINYSAYLFPCSSLMCFSILDLNLNGWRQCWHRYFPSTPLCCVEKIPSPDRSSLDFLLLTTPGWGKTQSLHHLLSVFFNWKTEQFTYWIILLDGREKNIFLYWLAFDWLGWLISPTLSQISVKEL